MSPLVQQIETARKRSSHASDETDRQVVLCIVQDLYTTHGIKALSTPFLEKQRNALYPRLLAAGLKQKALLEALGLTKEYTAWREATRTYRGVTKPKWSWESAVTKAKEIVVRDGELPTVEWCRRNGLSSFASAVHNTGRTWEDLRIAVGLKPSTSFYPSRNGMRWRSRPEACLSDFLYARGVVHRRGDRYPADYSKQTGRAWGSYDLHFQKADGTWIDAEVWGDPLNRISGGRYQRTRALKEAWQGDRVNFLGIPYQQCLSDVSLTKILAPFIGIIEPFVFDKPSDSAIETSHWSDADEFLEECRKFSAAMPEGVFPSEDWLRKRGKHRDRPGPLYNTIAIRVNQWLGGTRNVRRLLGHDHASTTKWTSENLKIAWDGFERQYGVTPSYCRGMGTRKSFPPEVIAEASKIDEAARRHGLFEQIRGPRNPRKIIWTPEYTLDQWQAFILKHNRTPSQCMSKIRRKTLSREVSSEATRIYDAARRLGILEQARANSNRAVPPLADGR